MSGGVEEERGGPASEDATLSSSELAAAAGRSPPSATGPALDDTIAALGPGFVVARRYRVVRFVAEGGMGQVYEVEDLELRERVALKRLRPDASQSGVAAERFKREIQLARRVTHPNVCRIFDLGLHRAEGAEEFEFLTMELLDCDSLAELIRRRKRLDTDEARRLVAQLASGLAALHEAGIVHRDFKSRNVLVTDRGRAVITDFGLARVVSGEQLADGASCTGALLGSPAYMAPEQVDGKKAGPAADVYALGVVMFEMVTGRLPFSGETPLATAFQRLKGEAPSPRVHVADLDARWEAAILRCLRRDPHERFGAVTDVVAAIDGPPRPGRRRASGPLALGLLAALAVVGALRYGRGASPRIPAIWAERLGPIVVTRLASAPRTAPVAPVDPTADTTTVWRVPIESSPSRGPDDALVTIVEFADFECPFSRAAERMLGEIADRYPADVRLVWKDYPMGLHARALPAAMLAREALAEKGNAGFWSARSRLFETQPNLDDARLLTVGRGIGLDPAAAKRSLALREHEAIDHDIDLADNLRVGGIPVFFVNGRRFLGADGAALQRGVAEELERAQALVTGGIARKDVYETVIRGGRVGLPRERRPALEPAGHPARGSARADAILIEELGDFQDVFCRMRRPLLEAILAQYGDRVRLVWFDAPGSDHADARLAATAARLAYGQGGDDGFWKMAALLLENQEKSDGLKRDALLGYAARLGLDTSIFKYGLSQGVTADVDKDALATKAMKSGPDDTTSLLLDGYPLDGAEPFRIIAKRIERILAERGGRPAAAPGR